MKVIITDKRETPRVIYIDGKGYVLPSNRPITMNISDRAKTILDRTEFIQVIKSEMKASDNRKSNVSDKELLAPESSPEQETIDKKVEDEKKEDKVEEKEDTIEEKKDNEVQEPVVTRQAPVSNKVEKSEPVIEEQENNEPTIEEQEEIKEESQEEIKEEKPDYSSMLVRELKEILDARGVDYKGWLKKDMVEYLENN